MNSECNSNPPQQHQKTVSPSEYAAGGDAPRCQLSSNRNLVTHGEMFAMSTSVKIEPQVGDNRTKIERTGHCSNSKIDEICSNSKIKSLRNVASVMEKDSSFLQVMSSPTFAKNGAKKSRSGLISDTMGSELASHSFAESEPPCKEYSQEKSPVSNHKNSATCDLTDSKAIEQIFSPSRKISMFSAEIWTEKILPIDTFVSPEPELIEIYFDRSNKITNQSNDIGDNSTESVDISPSSNLSALGRNISRRPPLPARKDRSLSFGQKIINFDDEMWSVHPELIPGAPVNKLPKTLMDNRYETISPEKLNDNEEEITSKTRNPSANIFKTLSRSSEIDEAIEPTHEIEGYKLFDLDESRKNMDNNYSRSATSRTRMTTVRISQEFDRVSHEPSPFINILDQEQNCNFREQFVRHDSSVQQVAKRKGKSVKVVRFNTSETHGQANYDGGATGQTEDLESHSTLKRCSAASAHRRQSKGSHEKNSLYTGNFGLIRTDQTECPISEIFTSTEKIVTKLDGNESSALKAKLISGAATNPRIGRNQQKLNKKAGQKSYHQFEDKQTPVSPSTCAKNTASTESTKTLKKLINGLWDNRPLHSLNNANFNQKQPVWKPGGNSSAQPASMTVIINPQKIRPPSSASLNKKKFTKNEPTRNARPHHRTKPIPETVEDSSKIVEKCSMNVRKTSSLAKIRTVPARRRQSEVVCLDNSKVQIKGKIEETKARKARSKSRTRTRRTNKVSGLSVTEIPLEHAEHFSPVVNQNTFSTGGLTLSKKSSSSPKDIIQMLKELIKSSGSETLIHDVPPDQIVGRCDGAKNVIKVNVDDSPRVQMEIEPMNKTHLTTSSNQSARETKKYSENQSIQSESMNIVLEKSRNDNKNDVSTGREKLSADVTLSKSDKLQTEFDDDSSINTKEFSVVSRSKSSETHSNPSMKEGSTSPVLRNIGCTAELSSEHSIRSEHSKFCQSSLTSLTCHEISDAFISSQTSSMEITSCSVNTLKNSNETVDIEKDLEVTRDICVQQFQKDHNATTSNGTALKKQTANKHAKSLEMLKKILKDQGLSIELLSRAEDELRDRCKSTSSKRRKTSQDANLINSKISSSPINDVLSHTNFSITPLSSLTAMSESEDDLNYVEAATMTSGKNSDVDSIAIQSEIASTSDMCVGDDFIFDLRIPPAIKNPDIPEVDVTTENISEAHIRSSASLLNENECIKCELPSEILDAFKLAATRACNLYAAVNILKGTVTPENVTKPYEQHGESVTNSTDKSLKRKVASRKTVAGNEATDKQAIPKLNQAFESKNRSSGLAEFSQDSPVCDRKTNCQSPSPNQQNLVQLFNSEEQVQTLHFAGRPNTLAEYNSPRIGSDIIESNPESSKFNSVNCAARKDAEKIRDSVSASPIRTLLEENLQRYKTNYNPIFSATLVTDSIESSDEDTMNNETLAGTSTSVSCNRLDDCEIFTEVNFVVNYLLNEAAKNDEIPTMTEQRNLNTHSPRRRRLRKPVRRLKLEIPEQIGGRSLFCRNHFNGLGGLIVFRKHLLSLIYAAICSFVFCCLQLSVHCEV